MAVTSANLYADPPGVEYPPELRQQLSVRLQTLGPDYRPRTEHLRENGQPEFTNRLVLEDSPYLLQHAHNPVDWHAWGPQAFETARREDKPVFLSIGYSTCHWCHVMERESFESVEVAEYLNTHFISIKVDREQRPDIDEIYMTGVQIVSGHGGWPMSSFLTADARTFFGGTYYPQAQFLNLLQQVTKVWNEDRAGIYAQAEKLTIAVQGYLDQARGAGTLNTEAPEKAATQLRQRHDNQNGGFSPAPKFPNEANYLFLIDFAQRFPDPELTKLIRFDLEAMARGGICDQVGGGFHRYSTDDDWLVPHFEKMLYNQAQLARTYLDAAALTGDPEFIRVARHTLDYVLRDMTAPDGAFYSASDADSEGGEGLFFLWTPAQVRAVLTQSDAEFAIRLFQLTEAGNFEQSNIPHLSAGAEAWAAEQNMSRAEFLEKVDQIRELMYQARELREHPGLDDKIITAWNGMMIMALAQAGRTADGERHADAAIRAGEYLWRNHRDGNGQLYRASLAGRASVPGVQEDYAWLADAFISLYDLSHDVRWLKRARQLLETMQSLFWDEARGGYFMSVVETDESATMPVMGRAKDLNDGATPSGNAAALHALARLARRPGNKDDDFWADARANALQSTFAPAVNENPAVFTYLLLAAGVHRNGETGVLNYAAHGAVRIEAHTGNNADGLQLMLELNMQPGWHVNAHEPLSAELIPTVLQLEMEESAWSLADMSYPQPTIKALGFQSENLALYEGAVQLTAQLLPTKESTGSPLVRARLRLQACDDTICLPPEDVFLQVPVR